MIIIKLGDIKIYLLDINQEVTNEFKKVFDNYKNISIINNDLISFLNSRKVECIVSPANSFGMMDGGYDLAITNYYEANGIDIISIVQEVLWKKHLGEQPIGTSELIETGKELLIHTPSMRVPMNIAKTNNVYMCMKSVLLCAIENDIASIVIPAFGGGCGQVNPIDIAHKMRLAYERVLNMDDKIDLSNWNNISLEVNRNH